MRAETQSDRMPGFEIVVLDHDEWRRRGLTDGVRELGVATVHAPSPDALARVPWDRVRLALVGVDMPVTAWDRYAGLRLVRAARDRAGRGAGLVTVALTTAVGNPLVAVRAGEAGVDHLYPSHEVGDLETLGRVVTAPGAERAPLQVVDHAGLRLLGVTFGSRLTAGLDLVEALGLAPVFSGPGGHGLTRRRAITVRRRLAETIGVRPVGPASASAHQPSIPSWRHLRELLDLARGATTGCGG